MALKNAAELMAELAEQPRVELHYDLRNPCADCPFTRNGPPDHSGVLSSLPAYLELLKTGDLVHSCHKTDPRPGCDGNRDYEGKTQHCSGVLQMFAKSEIGIGSSIFQALSHGVDLGELIDRAKSNNHVFGSIGELIEHYLPAIERLAKGEKADG